LMRCRKAFKLSKKSFTRKKEDIDDNNFMGSEIISETRFDSSKERIQQLLNLIECTYADSFSFIITQENQLANMKKVKSQGKADLELLINWLRKTNIDLEEQVNTQVADFDEETIGLLIDEHEIFQDELFQKQIELTNIRKILPTTENLDNLWNQVWVLAFDRQRILQEAKHRYESGFNYKDWQKRFVGYLRHKSNTVMFDHFREFDLHNTGIVTGSDFKKAIVKTGFPTSDANLEHVVGTLDQSKDNKIDYYKFIQSIASNTNAGGRKGSADGASDAALQDKIVSEVGRCTCENRFLLQKAGDRKYKFGDAEVLRMVRILRSNVMVRVGGGWEELDKFLSRYDPCRGIHGINNDITLDTWQMADYVTSETGERRSVTKHLETTMNFTQKSRGQHRNNVLLSGNVSQSCGSHNSSLNLSPQTDSPVQTSTPRKKFDFSEQQNTSSNLKTSTPSRYLGNMQRDLSNVSARSVNSNGSASGRSRSKIPVRTGRATNPGSRAGSRASSVNSDRR